jgi:hypothetical protein
MVVSSESGLSNLFHRTKRNSGGCLGTTKAIDRGNVFPNQPQAINWSNRNITQCQKGCKKIIRKIKYAVIKEESIVIGCGLEGSRNVFLNKIRCDDGFEVRTVDIIVVKESANGDRLDGVLKTVKYCIKT